MNLSDDVAQAARVSLMSASYAMNDVKVEVSPETRKRVMREAKRLGYHPSPMARAMQRKRSSKAS